MSVSTGTAVTVASIRRAMPAPVKSLLRKAWSQSYNFRFWVRYGFPAPPAGTDLVGYEALIEFFKSRELTSVSGDIVEIGSFCGGGTYKLAKFLSAQKSQKKLYSVDCFDIQVDRTKNTDGNAMAHLYERTLKGRSQREVFNQVTSGIPNIVVIAQDSKVAEIPVQSLCFGFVDGNHAEDYVINDFYLVWKKLSPGGAVAFHDYGFDLPRVTAAIDVLCSRHSSEIVEVQVDNRRHIIYIRKAVHANSDHPAPRADQNRH
jgi:hypothetical protein